MGGLERRIERLEEAFPSPPEPVAPEDLPVAVWVEEEMRGYVWEGLYGIEPDEEQFANWYAWRLRGLLSLIADRIVEGGHRLAEDPADGEEDGPSRAEEAIVRRVEAAFRPYALYWRQRFDAAQPKRELKREMARARGWDGSLRSR